MLATACVDFLRRLDPMPEKIVWISRQPCLGLLTKAFPDLHCVDLKQANNVSPDVERIVQEVGPCDLIIDLQRTLRSHLICAQLASTYQAKHMTWRKESMKRVALVLAASVRGRWFDLPQDASRPQFFQYKLMLDTLARGLKDFGFGEQLDRALEHSRPTLPIPSKLEEPLWFKELNLNPWIAVAPGAAHPTKKAPDEVFINILKSLAKRWKKVENAPPLGLVMLGNEQDRSCTVTIQDQLQWPWPTMNLAGKLSLWETTLAIHASRLTLSNDSSLAHISEALRRPAAVLFGPTVESFGFAPHLDASRAFSAPLGCRPCSKHGAAPCRYKDQRCFDLISASQVSDHLLSVLVS